MDTSLALALIAVAFGAGYFLGKTGRATDSPAAPTPPDRAALEAVRPILAKEGKIAAIKAYREQTGAGLLDARNAIESLETVDS